MRIAKQLENRSFLAVCENTIAVVCDDFIAKRLMHVNMPLCEQDGPPYATALACEARNTVLVKDV